MSLPKCQHCGKSVSNLVQHLQICKDAPKGKSTKVTTQVSPVDTPTVKKTVSSGNLVQYSDGIARLKPGRKPIHATCSICGMPHHAKGLCRRCYQRIRYQEGRTHE